jgi:hypothetical protein
VKKIEMMLSQRSVFITWNSLHSHLLVSANANFRRQGVRVTVLPFPNIRRFSGSHGAKFEETSESSFYEHLLG